jgi:hypothetical protein
MSIEKLIYLEVSKRLIIGREGRVLARDGTAWR